MSLVLGERVALTQAHWIPVPGPCVVDGLPWLLRGSNRKNLIGCHMTCFAHE